MKNKEIESSIVIVNYRVKKELFQCISSILSPKTRVTFEIIVVDNDKESNMGEVIKDKFPKVKYVKSPTNLGYGGGNNLGASYARGEYLFFLNPDTKILTGALNNLYSFFIKNKNVGIISPIFLDNDLKPFKSQGSKELTPKNILFSQSLLRKIFPSKNIYNDNILSNWNMKDPVMVDAVPGAAMMINANLFREIGGFDENFFLYFEENDISKRIGNLGYRLFIIPSAKIVHLVGRSTKHLKNMEDIYLRSRFLYLKKHYGILKAIFVQTILSINKTFIFLLLTLTTGLILRVINLENTMPFIGDQGWFYLSARDMLINGQIPLVGIASSHPWLHQGPLWTYLLAVVFWLFGFNPLNGAYLTVALGIVTILMVYVVGKELFSTKMGLISALLYATSPLAILHSRIPYHTSPIPLVVLFYIFSLSKWVKGNKIFFPLSILSLAVLYNFELATSTLWFVLLAILLYGIMKKKSWIKNIFNKKILIYSIASFLIPMIPILIYDFNHNFPQTLKFAAWIGYRVLRVFGFPDIHGEDRPIISDSMLSFSFSFYQRLIFSANNFVAFVILIFSSTMLLVNLLKRKKHELGFILLALWIIISLIGYFVNKTPSEAHLPILFPALIILLAFSFDRIMKLKKLFIPAVIAVILLSFVNSYVSVSDNYSEKGLNFYKRLAVIKEIVKEADGEEYNIIGSGEGSQFESFTMNYEYLAWWLGHSPSKSPQKLKFIIQENKNGVSLIKNE